MTTTTDGQVMADGVHGTRRRLRLRLRAGAPVLGTFVKLPSLDSVELVAAAGFDVAVIDAEHSALSEAQVLSLVRHADALGLPVVVRVPDVDPAGLNRILEHGAAGVQLSMLTSAAQLAQLVAAVRYPPAGRRSLSTANRAGAMGARTAQEQLSREAADPPLLVGQVETVPGAWLDELGAGLDVLFVGTTDLGVDLAARSDMSLTQAVRLVAARAAASGAALGGWLPLQTDPAEFGLDAARWLVRTSDLQVLATGLRDAARR